MSPIGHEFKSSLLKSKIENKYLEKTWKTCTHPLLTFQAKKTTVELRKIASKKMGNDENDTYFSNKVMNLRAIPIVPETNITIM